MQKNKIDRDIVVVLVMTLITVVSWAGFEAAVEGWPEGVKDVARAMAKDGWRHHP